MRHSAAILTQIQRAPLTEQRGKRYALVGQNPYITSHFRRQFLKSTTAVIEENVDPTTLKQSMFRLRDVTQTRPFKWESPMIWVEGAGNLFASMSFPDDFSVSDHLIVCCVDSDSTYIPPSFLTVCVDEKGGNLQDFIKWLMQGRGMTSEVDVIRFLTAEFKDNLPALEKLLDQMYLRIHPRTVLTLKDLEGDASLEWDCEVVIKALMEGKETQAFKEVMVALETFHPKGIVTVISRRVQLLIQIAASIATSGGSPDPTGDIRPWVWRNNVELVKQIPNPRLFKWALALDKAYAQMSKSPLPYQWVMVNLVSDMSRA
jgi:hypothetical protein